jgi:hypothetical protein
MKDINKINIIENKINNNDEKVGFREKFPASYRTKD